MASFDAKLEKKNGAPTMFIVRASGRLDATGLPILQERLDSIRTEQTPRVIFDLAGLNFVGSAGIGLLLSFVEEIREAKGDARFVNVPESVRSVLSLLNITDFLTQSGSADQAAAELSA